jgi:hypothetical protein
LAENQLGTRGAFGPSLLPIQVVMKAKHALILYALGLCGDVIGGLFTIEHWEGGRGILLAASFLKMGGILLLLVKVLTYPKVKEFLNL